jgi:hypothetical protein
MAGRILVLAVVLALLAGADANGRDAASSAAPGKAKVWFAPLPPMPIREGRPYIGASDFMRLFSRKARWSTAAKRIAAFKLYGEWVDGSATDSQLRRVVVNLRRRNIALALETGPLDPTPECGEGIEGFATVASGLHMARRIKAAGGVLRFIALDEPFFYANRYQGPRACRWDAEKIAEGVAVFVRAVRSVFPHVAVGDIEPITSAADISAYVYWLDTYRAVSGENLAFIHLDMSYSLPGWEAMGRTVERAARERGIPFGLIASGDPADSSDAAWTTRARKRIERYEVDAGGVPDHVLFQSWHDRPNRTLPDTKLSTFSGLVRSYARPRTRLTLALTPDGADAVDASGRLLTAVGKPLSSTRVVLTVGLPVAGAEPLPLSTVSATTDAQGTFGARMSGLPSSGFEVRARYAGSARLWPSRASVIEGTPLSNLALGRPATAPAALPANPPSLAVDGNPATAWIAGTGPPMWIEIDLGVPADVVEVRLRVAQTPTGATTHRVLALTGSGWVTVAELVGQTSENQLLAVRPATRLDGVRSVRVETSQSPSWVAWREIEVIGSR